MHDILMTPLRLNELETLIENSVRKVLSEQSRPDSDGTDQLLSITQASNFIGLKVPTLYSKASLGTIPCNKQAGRLYFLKSELTKWIQEGRRKTLSEQTAEALNGLSKKKKGVNHA